MNDSRYRNTSAINYLSLSQHSAAVVEIGLKVSACGVFLQTYIFDVSLDAETAFISEPKQHNHKDVTRLQFRRRQSGQVKRRSRVSRRAQGAERGGLRRGGVALPAEEGLGRGYTLFLENIFII